MVVGSTVGRPQEHDLRCAAARLANAAQARAHDTRFVND
jgi:hypothetical protein